MNPARRRGRAAGPTLLEPLITPGGTRVTVRAPALRAAYAAHRGHEHDGRVGHRCRTCARYTAAVTLAAVCEETAP